MGFVDSVELVEQCESVVAEHDANGSVFQVVALTLAGSCSFSIFVPGQAVLSSFWFWEMAKVGFMLEHKQRVSSC